MSRSFEPPLKPQRALIRESDCIGCTKCLQACPVDAIVGAAKQMHTVLIQECTGCSLCVPACPVDCIDLIEQANHSYLLEQAQKRFQARITRLQAQKIDKDKQQALEQKRAYVQASIARGAMKRRPYP